MYKLVAVQIVTSADLPSEDLLICRSPRLVGAGPTARGRRATTATRPAATHGGRVTQPRPHNHASDAQTVPDWSGSVWIDLDRQCSPPSYFGTDWQQFPVGPDRGHSGARALTSNSM